MKLEKIKLAGFKSFVDATQIPIIGNLIGIVGPNGCGKSNIIDAVRWVMGESSAKHLRGGQMADVIFNGSSSRQPVSQASVELIFDNSESRAGGEFAKYNTISIKRQVNRDGLSVYELNGSRCRRKDITDLFLGTGLGARSYAIIEQGTISRVVEAKPEDLRVHIEEAAGISKYKERRHESETRMRHTRENLERLEDVREEVEKQLNHLQKQADKAEKYTRLKAEERQYKLELLAMRWQTYHQSAQDMEQTLQQVADQHNQLFSKHRSLEEKINLKRRDNKDHQEQLNGIQGEYYQAVSEVSRLQQAIKHNQQSQEETRQELDRLRLDANQSLDGLEDDKTQLEDIAEAIIEAETALANAKASESVAAEVYQNTQQEQQNWQHDWEIYRNEYSKFREQAEVLRTKINHLENQNQQIQLRINRLQDERDLLSDDDLNESITTLEAAVILMTTHRSEMLQQLESVQLSISELRQKVKSLHDDLHDKRAELHNVNGKITSLELLQKHAMGKDNKTLQPWLEKAQLINQPRLAEFLDVQAGWESAVETVLGSYLEAICLQDFTALLPQISDLGHESIAFLQTNQSQNTSKSEAFHRLADKVKSEWNLEVLLGCVFCAEDKDSALDMMSHLHEYQSVITPDCVWFGSGWIKIVRKNEGKTGVLQREKELRLFKQRQSDLQAATEIMEEQLVETETSLMTQEQQQEKFQQQDQQLASELSKKSADLSAQSARFDQQKQRLERIVHEMAENSNQIAENKHTITELQLLKEQAEQKTQELDQHKLELEKNNQILQEKKAHSNTCLSGTRQQVHQFESKIASLKTAELATNKQFDRLQNQHRQSVERISDLEKKLEQALIPMDGEQSALTMQLETKSRLDETLKNARHQQETIETEIVNLTEQQTQVQRALENQKHRLDELRFEQQESVVRQQTVTEQLEEIEADVEQVLANLPDNANEQDWKETVEKLSAQIDRLGAINLSAIDEYQAQFERMNFLNEQHADLVEALTTLDQAINKIDKESRQRFKETFDKVNSGLQAKFPKLFGGGQAYLELTEQDLLETGINIIARPPGKRNSSIHLLSGGEKALTAVALVFSIFDLNPAPFCLLDEVDAPLDDANVVRFSQMVEEMSQSVQFLFISHNKVTMEIAKQLAGVTMKEPGVSRMVSVDIEEAVGLAEEE